MRDFAKAAAALEERRAVLRREISEAVSRYEADTDTLVESVRMEATFIHDHGGNSYRTNTDFDLVIHRHPYD